MIGKYNLKFHIGFALSLCLLVGLKNEAKADGLSCIDLFVANASKSERSATGQLRIKGDLAARLRGEDLVINPEAQKSAEVRKSIQSNLWELRSYYRSARLHNNVIEDIANRAAYDLKYRARVEKFINSALHFHTQFELSWEFVDGERLVRDSAISAYAEFLGEQANIRPSTKDQAWDEPYRLFEMAQTYIEKEVFDQYVFNEKRKKSLTAKDLESSVRLIKGLSNLPYLAKQYPEVGKLIESTMSFGYRTMKFNIPALALLLNFSDYSNPKAMDLVLTFFQRIIHKEARSSDAVFDLVSRVMTYEVSSRGDRPSVVTSASLLTSLKRYGLIADAQFELPNMSPYRFTNWMNKLSLIEPMFRESADATGQLSGWQFNALAQKIANERLIHFNQLMIMAYNNDRELFVPYLAFLKSPRSFGWPKNLVGMQTQALFKYSIAARKAEISEFAQTLSLGKQSRLWRRTHNFYASKEPLDLAIAATTSKLEQFSIAINVNKSHDPTIGSYQFSRYPDGTAFLVYESLMLLQAASPTSSYSSGTKSELLKIVEFIDQRIGRLLLDTSDQVQESVAYSFRTYRSFLENLSDPTNSRNLNFFEMMQGLGIP